MSGFTAFRKKVKSWKLPAFLLNRYVFTSFIFLVWMIFFDQNNLFVQMERYGELKDTRDKMEYYRAETERTKNELQVLMNDKNALERFAREKYYMKKPNEDVFVIVER